LKARYRGDPLPEHQDDFEDVKTAIVRNEFRRKMALAKKQAPPEHQRPPSPVPSNMEPMTNEEEDSNQSATMTDTVPEQDNASMSANTTHGESIALLADPTSHKVIGSSVENEESNVAASKTKPRPVGNDEEKRTDTITRKKAAPTEGSGGAKTHDKKTKLKVPAPITVNDGSLSSKKKEKPSAIKGSADGRKGQPVLEKRNRDELIDLSSDAGESEPVQKKMKSGKFDASTPIVI
jgi:hypothetical protein